MTAVSAAILCFILLFSGRLASQSSHDPTSFERIHDNSDWWSTTIRANDDAPEVKPQKLETDPSNFQIAGIVVGEDELPAIASKLGNAKKVSRGDGETGRHQICYVSADAARSVHLIFESGEVQDAAYLFEGGPNWTGEDLCVKSDVVTADLHTDSGLRLGLTPAEVEKILGKPTANIGDKLIYFRWVKRKNSLEDLWRLRRENPDHSDADFHKYFDYYDLMIYIEVRFSRAKVSYLGLSMSETM